MNATVDNQRGRVTGNGDPIRSTARVIANVVSRQRLNQENGGARTGGDDGDAASGADRPLVVKPLDVHGRVTSGQDARNLTRFAFVDFTERERHDLGHHLGSILFLLLWDVD